MMDELGLYDKDLIISFLFHDVGEDTPLLGNRSDSYDDFVKKASYRLSKLFGNKVADTVIRLTKPEIDQTRFFSEKECLAFYESELTKSDEAILGKEVDRLHNLRTVLGSGWKTFKIQKLIEETKSVYLPIFTLARGPLKSYSEVLRFKIETELKILKASI